ncbi:hypothetical protein [Amycolatopsis nigrescens]|uniref:hypothetical protein n=1 Tax=Amycolatopsis nigrescens TaxID=381445 RepID=UPI00058E200E|nr:hypothetical protein [Amycolatopsis nigrescens]
MSFLVLACRALLFGVLLLGVAGTARDRGGWAQPSTGRPLPVLAGAEAGTAVLLAVPAVTFAGFVLAVLLFAADLPGARVVAEVVRSLTLAGVGAAGLLLAFATGRVAPVHPAEAALGLAVAVAGLLLVVFSDQRWNCRRSVLRPRLR